MDLDLKDSACISWMRTSVPGWHLPVQRKHLQLHKCSDPVLQRSTQNALGHNAYQTYAPYKHTALSPENNYRASLWKNIYVGLNKYIYNNIYIFFLTNLIRVTYSLFKAPPMSQSHGLQPSISLLRPQCWGWKGKLCYAQAQKHKPKTNILIMLSYHTLVAISSSHKAFAVTASCLNITRTSCLECA